MASGGLWWPLVASGGLWWPLVASPIRCDLQAVGPLMTTDDPMSTSPVRCDLQAHVATMTPYSLLAASLGLGLCSIPVGLGWYGPLTALALSTLAMAAIIHVYGVAPPTA